MYYLRTLFFILIFFSASMSMLAQTTCEAPSEAQWENLTQNSIDLVWNETSEAIGYEVFLLVNGQPVIQEFVVANSVTFLFEFFVGDVLSAEIITHCIGGGTSGTFTVPPYSGIVAEVDLVLGMNPDDCDNCQGYRDCGNGKYVNCNCSCNKINKGCNQQLSFQGRPCGVALDYFQSPTNDLTLADKHATERSGIQTTIFPNPTTGVSEISFHLTEETLFHLALYDSFGRKIKILLPRTLSEKGHYNTSLDMTDLAPGLYYCYFHTGDSVKILKVMKM